MFQRIGIDQHSTLNNMRKRARRNALHVLSRSSNESILTAYIYQHKNEKKCFALSYEEIKSNTMEILNFACADKLYFSCIDGKSYEILNGKEILLGNFPTFSSPPAVEIRPSNTEIKLRSEE